MGSLGEPDDLRPGGDPPDRFWKGHIREWVIVSLLGPYV